MQAILTKFHGPTNVKGSRYSATCQAGRITLGADHTLNSEGNHIAVAQALAVKLRWDGKWHGGQLPSGNYCFVQPSNYTMFMAEGNDNA